jgi:choline-glycine betaine transporter
MLSRSYYIVLFDCVLSFLHIVMMYDIIKMEKKDRRTERLRDRQVDRVQKETQTDRQTETNRQRQTDKQTERQEDYTYSIHNRSLTAWLT